MFDSQTTKGSIRKLTAAVAIAAGVFATAQVAEAARFNRSRAAIERICDRLGGAAFNTRGQSGDYGCAADNAWIYCKGDGSCEGGSTAARRTTAKRPNRALPPARR